MIELSQAGLSFLVGGSTQTSLIYSQLNFNDCKAKIRQVDAHSTLGNGVVVQVCGELSNRGMPLRRYETNYILDKNS